MSYLYETPGGQGFFLYDNANEIILRKKEGHQFYPPVVLVKDYSGFLTDSIYNSTIYYCYMTDGGSLMLRSVLEFVLPIEIEAKEGYKITEPKLVRMNGKLLLFYIECGKDYVMNGILPYEDGREVFCFRSKDRILAYQIMHVGMRLVLGIGIENNYVWLILSDTFQTLEKWSEQEGNDSLQSAEREISQLKNTIAEKERAIQYYKEQVQSATMQYEELMKVAKAYQEEVKKWQGGW